MPRAGDTLLHDEVIHASVHDGAVRMRCTLLSGLFGTVDGKSSVFVAVESVYGMDGTISPLRVILHAKNEVSPAGNTYLVVDEAHATGLYGPGGRG